MKTWTSLILTTFLLCAACSSRQKQTTEPPKNWQVTLARQAMTAALLNDDDELKETHRLAAECEKRLDGNQRAISDQIALLQFHTENPAERSALLDTIDRADAASQVHIQAARSSDPITRIKELRRQDRFNRLADAFNFTTRAATSAIQLNVAGLARSAIDLLFLPARLRETTTHQKRVLDLLAQWQNEALATPLPSDPPGLAQHRSEQRRALIALEPYRKKLQNKIDRLKIKDAMAAAKWHLERKEYRQAHNVLRSMAPQHPQSDKRLKLQTHAASMLSEIQRTQTRTLRSPLTVHPQETARLVRLALAANQPRQAAALASNLIENGDIGVRDDAALVQAICEPSLLTKPGLQMLNHSPQTAARHYRNLREKTFTYSQHPVKKARTNYKKNYMQYILTGTLPLNHPPNAYTARKRAHRIVSTIGLMWPVQWAFRAIVTRFKPIVSDEDWRDAAAEALRRSNPDRTLAGPMQNLANQLAESYAKRNRYEDACRYLKMADAPHKTILQMQEKHARYLLEKARNQTVLKEKILTCHKVLKKFPDSPHALEAKDALDQIASRTGGPVDQLQYTIPRTYIRRNQEAFASLLDALALPRTCIDGEKKNGELDAEGLHFFSTQPPSIGFQIHQPDGRLLSRSRQISTSETKHLNTVLEILVARQKQSRRAEALFERLPIPLELRASAGPGGFDAYPKLQKYQLPPEQIPLYQ